MYDDAEYFIAIAEAGSISAAARQLHLSQPALSQRLRKLEDAMGAKLVNRDQTPIRLTYEGEVYLEWARETRESAQRMQRKIESITAEKQRRLRIGTSLPRGAGILPDVVSEFHRQKPDCTLLLFEAGMPDSHENLFRTSGIDFSVLTPSKPASPFATSQVICFEQMLLVAPRTYELSCKATDDGLPIIEPEVIGKLPFILPPANLKHSVVVKTMMDTAKVKLRPVLRSCSNDMTLQMVERGLGVTIAPGTFVGARHESDISLYQIAGFQQHTPLYYNRVASMPKTSDEELFIELLKAWVAEHPQVCCME